MCKKLIIPLIFLILIPSVYSQLTIGVSPPVLNLGEISPSSSKIARFSLVTTSSDVVLTYLTPMNGRIEWFRASNYKNYVSNYSEQEISDWIQFTKNPAEVRETVGGSIKGASEVIFILKTPEDLEPGYHMGQIALDPVGPDRGGMFSIKATVPLIFIFNTPGKAIRSAKIIDVVPGDYSDNNLKLNMYVQNTGTVTLQTFNAVVDIFDKDGKKIASLNGGGNSIKPDEVRIINLLWDVRDVEEGVYDASAKFDYLTGSTSKNTTIELSKISIIPTPKVVEEVYVFPWWIIIIVIVILIVSYLIYRS